MQYASETSVSVARSRAEIEEIVMRYGAKSFGSGQEVGRAMVFFEKNDRRIRFMLPLPAMTDKEFTTKSRYRRYCLLQFVWCGRVPYSGRRDSNPQTGGSSTCPTRPQIVSLCQFSYYRMGRKRDGFGCHPYVG